MKCYFAEACHNTFILMDCLESFILEEEFLKKARCWLEQEERDDILILVRGRAHGSAFYAQMLVLGLDGTLGEFCGNGARVCAAYLFASYPSYQNFFLVTKYGKHCLTREKEGIYSIRLPPPLFEANRTFINKSDYVEKHYGCFYVEVIEPHLVIPRRMTDEELFQLGRELNCRKDLFPRGINVNSYFELEEGSLYVKTYERGVQRLTESCGTGSIACAAIHTRNKKKKVHIINSGGVLEVEFQKDGVLLTGPALVEPCNGALFHG